MAVIRIDGLDAEGAVTTGGDGTMGAGEALGSPVLEKITVELSGFEGDAAGLATGNPVLEKITVELSGFEGDAAGLATGNPVLEKMTVELIGFEGNAARLATGIPVLEKITVELSGFNGDCVCIGGGSEDETAKDNAIGPGATNIDVVLLVGGITATGVSGASTAELILGGGVTDAAGGSVTALEVEVTVVERAMMELGGSACGGSRLDGERAVVVTGSTVPTTPSIIVIVV